MKICFILTLILRIQQFSFVSKFNQLLTLDSSSLSEAETWTQNSFSF